MSASLHDDDGDSNALIKGWDWPWKLLVFTLIML